MPPHARFLALFVLAFCLAAASTSPAQTTAPHATNDEITRHVPASTVLANTIEHVPFKLQNGRIVVELSINDAGPFPFILDTCSGTFIVDPGLAAELSLPVIGATAMGDPTDPHAIAVEVAELESVTLGGATFSDFTTNVWDSGGFLGTPGGPRGIVGFPMFRNTLLTIDWEAGELLITDDVLPSPNGDDVLELSIEGDVPSIEFMVNDVPVRGHFDTGAPMGIGVPERLAADEQWETPPRVIAHARTVNGTFEIKGGTLDGTVSFGGHQLENPMLMTNERFHDANVGIGLLRHFRLTFDQRNARLQMTRQGEGPIDLSPQSRSHRH